MKLTKQPVRLSATKNLRTSVGRPASRYAKDDYEEPNVRLSRAFIVVLLLHVVAVGGIFTFSALKDRQSNGATAKSNTDSARPLTATKAVQKLINPTHKVKQGETLSGIAFQYGINVRDLEQANSLKAGTQVNAGRELIIPEKTGATNVPPDVQRLVDAQGTTTYSKTQGGSTGNETGEVKTTYIVQKGDSPGKIAKKFKVGYDELLKVNGIENPKRLQVGQKLTIP